MRLGDLFAGRKTLISLIVAAVVLGCKDPAEEAREKRDAEWASVVALIDKADALESAGNHHAACECYSVAAGEDPTLCDGDSSRGDKIIHAKEMVEKVTAEIAAADKLANEQQAAAQRKQAEEQAAERQKQAEQKAAEQRKLAEQQAVEQQKQAAAAAEREAASRQANEDQKKNDVVAAALLAYAAAQVDLNDRARMRASFSCFC